MLKRMIFINFPRLKDTDTRSLHDQFLFQFAELDLLPLL